MKAIQIDSFGGVEKLILRDIPVPPPEANEVQIHIVYSSVNPVDWKIGQGLLKEKFPCVFPFIPGWDAAGIVSAVGSKVTAFKKGDEVFAYCRKPIVQWGTYAEYVCVDADAVALKPTNINFAEAAAIPLVGLTAWQSLFDFVKLQKGETVLIHAGAGGVGSFAVQFAKNAGARVITTASAGNHAYVTQLGADVVLDYTKGNLPEEIKRVAPEGIDVIFNTVGGQTIYEDAKWLKKGGRLASIANALTPEEAAQYGIKASYILVRPNGKELAEIAQLVETGKIKPVEIQEFPLEKAADAQKENQKGHTRGKIVLKI